MAILTAYSIKDQGYIWCLTCVKCFATEVGTVRGWVKVDDPRFSELIDMEFPGWTVKEDEILCPACSERERNAKSTP